MKQCLPETDKEIGCGDVAAVILHPTELRQAYGNEAEVAPAGETERDGKRNDDGLGIRSRQPQGEDRNRTQGNGHDDDVEPAESIREEPGDQPTEEAPRVQQRKDGEAKRGILTVSGDVRADVRQGYKQAPFHEEHPSRAERKAGIFESGQIRNEADGLIGRW